MAEVYQARHYSQSQLMDLHAYSRLDRDLLQRFRGQPEADHLGKIKLIRLQQQQYGYPSSGPEREPLQLQSQNFAQTAHYNDKHQ